MLCIVSEYSQIGFLEVMVDEFGRISDILGFLNILDVEENFFKTSVETSKLSFV